MLGFAFARSARLSHRPHPRCGTRIWPDRDIAAPSAPYHRTTPVSPDRAACSAPHTGGKSPAFRRERAKSRETRTVRWREPDSNFSSLSGSVPLRAGGAGAWKPMAHPKRGFSVAGPLVRIHLPPAIESGANLISGANPIDRRRGFRQRQPSTASARPLRCSRRPRACYRSDRRRDQKTAADLGIGDADEAKTATVRCGLLAPAGDGPGNHWPGAGAKAGRHSEIVQHRQPGQHAVSTSPISRSLWICSSGGSSGNGTSTNTVPCMTSCRRRRLEARRDW